MTLQTSSTFAARRTGRRGLAGLVAALALAVGSTIALSAWAQPAGPAGMGPHGGAGAMGMPMMGRGLDRMLDSVNATPDQRAQIRQIGDALRADMKAQHEAGRAVHERALEVFTAPNVDANAAEAVRQQMLQQHDQASRRTMQAMLDISRVLTPEQRQKLAAQMKERAARMHQHMEQQGARPRQ